MGAKSLVASARRSTAWVSAQVVGTSGSVTGRRYSLNLTMPTRRDPAGGLARSRG